MSNDYTTTLNGLLRGELSALETYEQALEKIEETGDRAVLRRIQLEHDHAAQALREHIRALGGEPQGTSGTWGAFTHLFEGAAGMLGATPALRALREGEQQGVADYQRSLEEDDMPEACRTLIQTGLLPQTRAHVVTLDSLLGA